MNKSKIILPQNHTAQLHEALRAMEGDRFIGRNILNYLKEVRNDLTQMGLTQKEIDYFEFGFYLADILRQQNSGYNIIDETFEQLAKELYNCNTTLHKKWDECGETVKGKYYEQVYALLRILEWRSKVKEN